ncbi:unnamed protein product [Fraxinus pennsylvanica]|uniref:Uncharacterized protein n=1 Tax=Fraxinus pennsylvanica TaxID=56036 RepID=A0AAD2DYK2_9LAMI|nr:unnamed protein product [Fraxinus pennsylvanica]
MAQPNSKEPTSQNYKVKGSHSRSLYRPLFSTNNGLSPLSHFPCIELLAFSNYSLMEETDVTREPPVTPYFPRKNVWQGSDSLLPCKGHQRSSSDIPLRFSTMIKSSPLLVPTSG